MPLISAMNASLICTKEASVNATLLSVSFTSSKTTKSKRICHSETILLRVANNSLSHRLNRVITVQISAEHLTKTRKLALIRQTDCSIAGLIIMHDTANDKIELSV